MVLLTFKHLIKIGANSNINSFHWRIINCVEVNHYENCSKEILMLAKNKVCIDCKTDKPISEFHVHETKKEKTYYKSRCKTCQSQFLKDKDWPKSDGSVTHIVCNKCKITKSVDEFCKNRRNKRHGRRTTCRDCGNHCNMLCNARNRAIEGGLDFNLTLNDIIIPEICPILKIPLKFGRSRKNENSFWDSPSLDRIDNSKGYTKDNVMVVSAAANLMKSFATFQMLYNFCIFWMEYLKDYKFSNEDDIDFESAITNCVGGRDWHTNKMRVLI